MFQKSNTSAGQCYKNLELQQINVSIDPMIQQIKVSTDLMLQQINVSTDPILQQINASPI